MLTVIQAAQRRGDGGDAGDVGGEADAVLPGPGDPRGLPPGYHLGELPEMWQAHLCVRPGRPSWARPPVSVERHDRGEESGPKSPPRARVREGGARGGELPDLRPPVRRTGGGQRADLRPAPRTGCGGAHRVGAAQKKIAHAVRQEVAQEIARLVARVLQDGQRLGHLDLEASEMALRAAMHQLGGRVLEQLLNADGGGYRGARIPCGHGHHAEFVDHRRKQVLTVLAPVAVQRAYYHCAPCAGGVVPKDQELDIVGTAFSPGVRRMLGRVGGAEALGAQVEAVASAERTAALTGKVITLKAVPRVYIAIDGTGVPMVPHETDGRQGKEEAGKAKTREAKLGCVFTQTSVDEQGRPVRDEDSSTYVGAIEPAEAFGRRIYAEAVRRGIPRAAQVIVLGDGAPWIWGIAEEHFPGAIQIVDLYHAREHLADLSKLVYGPGSAASKRWTTARRKELDAGDVERVVAAMGRLRARGAEVQQAVRRGRGYFETNAKRMRYARFRSQGLFVGSGVVEAACKTVVGFRLKQSGMRWTVRGANAIIALRCADLSGRWEEFWEARSAG